VVSNSRKVSTLEEAFVGLGTPRKDDPFAAGYGKFCQRSKKSNAFKDAGSAALGLTYVASGALDAFLLPRFELWDVAAGRLLVEVSGGSYWQKVQIVFSLQRAMKLSWKTLNKFGMV